VREIGPPSREASAFAQAAARQDGVTGGIRRIKIGLIEAFDGTPVVDIKSASTRADG
jgi:tRNA (Thr-GGU) A37 N-methylase